MRKYHYGAGVAGAFTIAASPGLVRNNNCYISTQGASVARHRHCLLPPLPLRLPSLGSAPPRYSCRILVGNQLSTYTYMYLYL